MSLLARCHWILSNIEKYVCYYKMHYINSSLLLVEKCIADKKLYFSSKMINGSIVDFLQIIRTYFKYLIGNHRAI